MVYGANIEAESHGLGMPWRRYGTAILSPHPIIESHNTPLPTTNRLEQRGLLFAQVNLEGIDLSVFTTHLQYHLPKVFPPELTNNNRLDQTRRIIKIIAEKHGAVVLTGDLNARPESPEIAELSTVISDAWLLAHGSNAVRVPTRIHPGKPERDICIDYIFGANIQVHAVLVLPADVSDHRAVLMKATVRPVPFSPTR
jgi:endonuclease/exonuclease/phosphatase family metal-dependent hydrolase